MKAAAQLKQKRKKPAPDFNKRERDIREALFAVVPESEIAHETLWQIADAMIDELRKKAKWL